MSISKSKAINLSELSYKQYYWILVVAVIVVFGNTLFNGYNYDDNLVTMHHPLTSKGIKSIGKIFTSPYYSNGADISFGYRPIVHLSFAIEHQFFGEKPGVSHFFNLLIYLGCVLTFFKLISSWFGQQGLFFAFAAAVVFAVHPIHSEAVASIKNRDELLAFLFAMLAFVQLNKYADKQQWWRIGLVVLFFVIGLLAKKSIYPLVFLVPLVHLFVKNQSSLKTIIITIIASVFVGLATAELSMERSVALIGAPILWAISISGFIVGKQKSKSINPKIGYYTLLVLATLCVVFSCYQFDYTFFVIAALLFLFLVYKKFNPSLVHLVVVLACVCAAHFLVIQELNHVAFLISIIIVVPQLRAKKYSLADLLALVISVAGILIHKPNVGVLILGLIYITAMWFWQTRKWITTLLFLVVSIVALVFFGFKYYYLIMLMLACYFACATWLFNGNTIKISPTFLVLILTVPIWFLPKTHINVVKNSWANFVDGQQLIESNTHQNQSLLNQTASSEGRSLSYVENTLIGSQTAEAKFTTGVTVIGEYIRLMAFPYELNSYYGFAKVKTSSFAEIWFWISLIAILSIGISMVLIKQNKTILIGLFWFGFSILLFSNWIELVAGMVGERLAFTASAGFILLFVSILKLAQDKNYLTQKNIFLVLATVGLLFSIRTIARNADWKSYLTLLENDIQHLSESVYANHMYAQACMNEATNNAKLDNQSKVILVGKAEKALISANKIYPFYFNAQFDLARIYLLQQRYADAKTYLENAYKLDTTNLFVLEELSKTYFDLNLAQETVYYGEKYLKQYTQNENMYEIVAYTLFKQGDYLLAKQYAENGLVVFPNGKNLKGLLADINKQVELMPNIEVR